MVRVSIIRTVQKYEHLYDDLLPLNDDLVSVDSWTKEQIEARTEKLVKLALQAFTFDDIGF